MDEGKIIPRVVLSAVASLLLAGCAGERRPLAERGGPPASSRSSSHGLQETEEPKLEFLVKIGAATFTLDEGEELPVSGTYTDPIVSVTVAPNRTFDFTGVRFEYPRGFAFEAAVMSENEATWTLSGNDIKIMVFRFPGKTSLLDDFSQSFALQIREGVIETTLQTLAGQEYPARRIRARKLETDFVFDIFELPPGKHGTILLVLQDSAPTSDESVGVRRLLQRTFELTK